MQHTRIRAYCQSAQTSLPFIALSLPHRRPSERRHVKRSAANNTDGPCAADADANLNDMGYRGEDVSRTPADWGQQAPGQSSPGTGQGNAGRGSTRHRVTATTTTTTTPRTALATATRAATATAATRSRSRDSTASAMPTRRRRPTEPGGYDQRRLRPAGRLRLSAACRTRRRVRAQPGAGSHTASRTTTGSPSRATARPAAARGIRRRTTATASRAGTGPAQRAGATPPCPTQPTAIRAGTPGTTGTAASPLPRPAPASPTPARTR